MSPSPGALVARPRCPFVFTQIVRRKHNPFAFRLQGCLPRTSFYPPLCLILSALLSCLNKAEPVQKPDERSSQAELCSRSTRTKGSVTQLNPFIYFSLSLQGYYSCTFFIRFILTSCFSIFQLVFR